MEAYVLFVLLATIAAPAVDGFIVRTRQPDRFEIVELQHPVDERGPCSSVPREQSGDGFSYEVINGLHPEPMDPCPSLDSIANDDRNIYFTSDPQQDYEITFVKELSPIESPTPRPVDLFNYFPQVNMPNFFDALNLWTSCPPSETRDTYGNCVPEMKFDSSWPFIDYELNR